MAGQQVTIIDDRPFAQVGAGGTLFRGRLIVYQLDGGATGHVFIPVEKPTEAQVTQAIQEQIRQSAGMVGRKLTV